MSPSFAPVVRSLAIVAASLSLLGPALPAQTSQSIVPSRIVAPVDESARVVLHGYVHPLANAANDRGVAPDSMPLSRMHLVLKRSSSQEAALKQFISDVHTPGGANYHQWLTPDQFGQQFGPSDQDVATVESWLSSHGFEVAGVEPGKQVIEFTGSVVQLREAFHAQIHKYQVNGSIHYAAANDPDIPAALSPVVGGFVALNNFRLKSHARLLGEASYDPKTGTAKPEWTVNGGEGYPTIGGVNFALTPGDFGVQYDLPNPSLNSHYTGTTYDGTGETIAIINDSNVNIDLVNQFRTLFGLPANPPNVVIDGNDPGIDGINDPDGPNYDSGEAYLDVEWSGAVAPKATVDLVIGADTALESGFFLAAEHAVYSNLAPIISVSFGACELSLGSTNQFIEQSLWGQAAAQGTTVMVSTGDNGSAGCDNPDSQEFAVSGPAISGFASTPYDVAVGGTDFYYTGYASLTLTNLAAYWNTTGSNTPSVSLLTRIPEQPWNNSQYGLDAVNYYDTYGATSIGAGSGGASSAAFCAAGYSSTTGACAGAVTGYPKPSWQTGAGVPADTVRDIPDVSLFAADGPDYSYYAMCYQDGDCQPNSSGPVQVYGVGGTSASAPSFAGIMALVDQKYGRQGQADFVLYPLKAQFPAAFHDVTVGTNSVPCESLPTASTGCIAVSNPIVLQSGTSTVTEGQIGTGTTPEYNAAAGYNLATGLGSVDAGVLVADWGNVTFKSTSTTLTPSSTSFTHGTAITVSGSVTGSTTPTGNVALMADTTLPLQQGVAVFPLSSGAFSATNVNYLPGGTYNVWGQYSGDGTNAASTSSKTQVTVAAEPSTTSFSILNAASGSSGATAFTPGNTSVPYGTQSILAAQVYGSAFYTSCVTTNSTAAACAYYDSPTGTVVFADNGTTINTAVLNAEGDAEFNAPFYVGSHSVTASYAGDASYQKSSGSAITFTVVKDTPDIYVGASNPGSAQFSFVGGQNTYLDILVENSANDLTESSSGTFLSSVVLPPTGSVTVTGLPGGSQTVNLVAGVDPSTGQPDGVAVVNIPASTAAGALMVGISYAGDSNYATSSGSGTITIVASTLLTSTITASMTGSISPTTSVTVTGTVTGQSGHPAPTGFIYVFPSGEGTSAEFLVVPGSGTSSTFSGILTSQSLFQGGNVVTLQYSGDKNYNGAAITLNNGTPISNPLSSFSLVASSSLVAVPASSTGTTTIFVTPTNGFTGTVNLACSVIGAPTGVSCSLSQSSVSLTASSSASLDRPNRLNLFFTGGGAALACVLLLTMPARRRAWRNLLSMLLFACIIA
ncbi:MAG: protease pro-enzyme activation domain-containing protein, partial [Acidobacteriaceae bacterium]